jgi:hypothetical protein
VKLSWLFVLVLILAPAVSRQVSDEAKAWLPWLVQRLTKRAITKLPVEEQERFAEEWPALVNEIPGDVGKMIFAIRLLAGAHARTVAASARRIFCVAALMTTAIVVILAVVGAASPARAWGSEGRRIDAEIAAQRLETMTGLPLRIILCHLHSRPLNTLHAQSSSRHGIARTLAGATSRRAKLQPTPRRAGDDLRDALSPLVSGPIPLLVAQDLWADPAPSETVAAKFFPRLLRRLLATASLQKTCPLGSSATAPAL